MEDLQLLFCIISLFAGISSITLEVFINIKHKKKSLKYFIGLDISLFIIQAMITLNLYMDRVNNKGTFLSIISNSMDILGTSFSSFFGLLFVSALLGKQILKLRKFVVTLVTAFQLSIITFCYLNPNLSILKYIGQASIIAVVSYEVLVVIVNYKKINDKDLNHAVKVFSMITLSFLPLLIFEYARSEINVFKTFKVFKMFTLPAYFFVINIGTLLWAYSYFNTPAYIVENELTKYFKEKYYITSKESEIIQLMLKGLTYKQIGENLIISPKTVDNHIQNIYKKLKVTNKIQLSNLIRSKEQ